MVADRDILRQKLLMPSLTIPERYQSALRELRKLTEGGVTELVAALGAAPISPDPREIASQITGKLTEIPPERTLPIVEAVVALYLVRAQAEISLDRFISDVVDAFPGGQDAPPIGSEATALKKRLKRLMSIENLSTVAKSVNLRSEYAETFCSARVLTDMRPVWRQSQPETAPIGAIVTHVLKLEYHHGTLADHRELYVGLD